MGKGFISRKIDTGEVFFMNTKIDTQLLDDDYFVLTLYFKKAASIIVDPLLKSYQLMF